MSDNPPPYSAPPPPPENPYGSNQPGAYGNQDPYGQQPKRGSGMAVAALVLGILALLTGLFFIGGLLGLIAIVLGVVASGRAKRGEAGGRGMAITGIVLGVIGVLLTILTIAGVSLLFNSGSGKDLKDCLQKAGNDQSAVQSCRDDFSKNLSN